jgi:AcrR family transcriptional regulator
VKSSAEALGPTARRKRARQGAAKPATAPRKASDTRERILRAAIAEFAKKGYSGARVDGICRAARANPRMIYHYFGGKAALYLAILEHVLGALRREELKLDVDHVAPFDGILQLFDFIHDHFGAHPELISLLMGENLLRAAFLRRSRRTPIISSPLLGLIATLLKRGEATGTLRPGIDPLQLYVAMVALSSYHRSNVYTLSIIFSTDLLDPDWQGRQKQQAQNLLASFLKRPAGRDGT